MRTKTRANTFHANTLTQRKERGQILSVHIWVCRIFLFNMCEDKWNIPVHCYPGSRQEEMA